MKTSWKALGTDRMFWFLCAVSALMVYVTAQGLGFMVGPDGNDYVSSAFQLFDPQRYGTPTDYIGLFYAVFLKGLFLLGGWSFPIFHHYLPAFVVPLIVYFALKPFHQPAAFVCGLLLAIDVNSMFHFAGICTEGPYIFWLSLVLWSFCRMLQMPDASWTSYVHGLTLVFLTLTRAAGRLLFVVLMPFYAIVFRSKTLLVRLLLIFLLPLIFISIVMTFTTPMTKFPSAIAPLTFLRAYGMVNPQSENLRHLIDTAESIYFERPLSPEAKALLVKDLLECNYHVSNMLFDISWSPHPAEFDHLVNAVFWESVKGLTLQNYWKITRIYLSGIYIQSEFTPVSMIYTKIFPSQPEWQPYDPQLAVFSRVDMYEKRYGAVIKKDILDYFKKKYSQIDYAPFLHGHQKMWAVRVLSTLSMIYPFFVQRWVFLLSLFALFTIGHKNKAYQLIAIFSMILFVYNYLLTMLFGPHERYRAPMDMFYFVPTAWFYAYLIFERNTSKVLKFSCWGLLVFAIFLNIQKMSPILKAWYTQSSWLNHMGI